MEPRNLETCFNSFYFFSVQALSKALSEDELLYLQLQFNLLEPNKDGLISLENFQTVGFHF